MDNEAAVNTLRFARSDALNELTIVADLATATLVVINPTGLYVKVLRERYELCMATLNTAKAEFKIAEGNSNGELNDS